MNHQFLRRMEKEGLITLKELFIDGTKIEADANRYTFAWRVIEDNRKRKLTKHKMISNNTVIEIDSYSKTDLEATFMRMKEDHEKRKPRAYKEDIGKYYNMTYAVFEDEPYYICHDGRELRHIRTESKEQDGYTRMFEVYGCADRSGCEHKSRCLYKYNAEKNAGRHKVMKIQTRGFCALK